MTTASLVDTVLDRLEASDLGERAGDLVLGALTGDLEGAIRVSSFDRPTRAKDTTATAEPAVAFLESLTVRGFRGIGKRATLELNPGPGLTLVVGRNGSGKSSFAEALELLLTGDNARWAAKKNRIWRDGWRNLHVADEPVEIEATLLVVGQSGATRLRRSWPAGADLEHGATSVVAGSAERASRTVAELGWEQPLVAYRPFLTYEELGSMLDEGPSKLFDKLSSILGVEELVDAAEQLQKARQERDRQDKIAKETAKALAQRANDLAHRAGDERAVAAATALERRVWDLEALEGLALRAAAPAGAAGALASLRGLAALEVRDEDQVRALAERLESARATVREHEAGGNASALRLAELLDRALEHWALEHPEAEHGHAAREPLDCPVCRAPRRLDEGWRTSAARERDELRERAAALREARRELAAAEDELEAALPDAAPLLDRATALGLSPSVGALALAAGAPSGETPAPAQPITLSLALERRQQLAVLRDLAAAELAARDDLWQPIARELAAWLPAARGAVAERDLVKQLKAAEQWLRDAATDIRNERFQPIKDQVLAAWKLLRTGSHVELEDVLFTGRATQRRIDVAVTVDGHEGAALGVMSQGELHALALALFLPRATVPESPFRFVVVDDPVQAMDHRRVDGLAQVLEQVGRERQVLVFTHDERLSEAMRRLGIDATHFEVERERESQVKVVRGLDPVERHLDEARALARSADVPVDVIERVVPGLCRMALEAACAEAVRRRRLGRGETWPAVERALDENARLLPRLALALFDDGARAGDVMTTINKWDRSFGDLVKTCNEGAHKGVRGVDTKLVGETKKLAEKLRRIVG